MTPILPDAEATASPAELLAAAHWSDLHDAITAADYRVSIYPPVPGGQWDAHAENDYSTEFGRGPSKHAALAEVAKHVPSVPAFLAALAEGRTGVTVRPDGTTVSPDPYTAAVHVLARRIIHCGPSSSTGGELQFALLLVILNQLKAATSDASYMEMRNAANAEVERLLSAHNVSESGTLIRTLVAAREERADRILAALAAITYEFGPGVGGPDLRRALLVALLADLGVPPVEAMGLAHDGFDGRVQVAGRRRDALIEAAKQAAYVREMADSDADSDADAEESEPGDHLHPRQRDALAQLEEILAARDEQAEVSAR